MSADSNPRVRLITERITSALSPTQLNIIDDSNLHAGHQGAKDGGGHFNIQVVSAQFQNKSAIERHRMIYMALGNAIGTDIHAISIKAQTPDESAAQQALN